jgi:hypothetical protein
MQSIAPYAMELLSAGQADTLVQGDAVYFSTKAVHTYERMGDTPCTGLILTTPDRRGPHRLNSSAGVTKICAVKCVLSRKSVS